MNASAEFLFAVQTAMDLVRIQSAARDLLAKGVTVTQIEEAILSEGIPVLPHVHMILVELEREAHDR